MNRQLPTNVTEEQLQELVRKHGTVYPVYVKKDDRTVCGLFKKPDLAIMGAAASAGTNDPVKAGQLIYNSCKLVVDPEMDSDDEVKMAAMNQVGKLFRLLEGEVGEPFVAGS